MVAGKGSIAPALQQPIGTVTTTQSVVSKKPRATIISNDTMFMNGLGSGGLAAKLSQGVIGGGGSQPRKTVMDMSRIKEQMKKMAVQATNEDLQRRYLKLVACPFRPSAVFSNVVGGAKNTTSLVDDLAFDSIVMY